MMRCQTISRLFIFYTHTLMNIKKVIATDTTKTLFTGLEIKPWVSVRCFHVKDVPTNAHNKNSIFSA